MNLKPLLEKKWVKKMTDILSAMNDLENAVMGILMNKQNPTQEYIEETVKNCAKIFPSLGKEDVIKVLHRIEEKSSFTVGVGSVLHKPFTPWLPNVKSQIDWYYWERYKNYLGVVKGFGTNIVTSMSSITDNILGLSEDPNKLGDWTRRGMVVGHVQSGKTANYLGLITKAADAGYKVFIIIAGITDNLRKQTQRRVEESFVGYDTSNDKKSPIGVGRFNAPLNKRPVILTTAEKDFNKQIASQVFAPIQTISTPLVFVIKKNARTLENLIDWLKQSGKNGAKIEDVPMMLIDDEADNASVNTRKAQEEASTINRLIRKLLGEFKQKCYIGYTATPFANIFIDDSQETEEEKDLFPEDFIYCLDAPSNYLGANQIFGCDDGEDKFLRVVDDNQINSKEGLLPISHKKDFKVTDLPDSLIDALYAFILVRAIRILRGDGNKHNSMLINVSKFNDVQRQINQKVSEYLSDAIDAIKYNYKTTNPTKNPIIARIQSVYKKEYEDCGFDWDSVLRVLHEAASAITVRTINQTSGDALDYEKYPDGLNLIAVGGFALSRGLTLEGLSISYIIRNTMMYDTLMQMGRWFGYRPKYQDLCRIYMPEEAKSWYEFITEATDELINDFNYMRQLGLSPKNFGLRVRQSPMKLLITARNKMRTGVTVTENVDLAGKYKETRKVFVSKTEKEANLDVFYNIIDRMEEKNKNQPDGKGAYLWHDVSYDIILDFVKDFKNYDGCLDTQTAPIHRFIKDYAEQDGKDKWDVVLYGLQGNNKNKKEFFEIEKYGIKIIKPARTGGRFSPNNDAIDVSSKQRMAFPGIEKYGVDPDDILQIDNDKSITNKDMAYRNKRKNPLLVLFITDISKNTKTQSYEFVNVPVYAVSFPLVNRDREYKGVEYKVNQRWVLENFGDLEDEGEEYDSTK